MEDVTGFDTQKGRCSLPSFTPAFHDENDLLLYFFLSWNSFFEIVQEEFQSPVGCNGQVDVTPKVLGQLHGAHILLRAIGNPDGANRYF